MTRTTMSPKWKIRSGCAALCTLAITLGAGPRAQTTPLGLTRPTTLFNSGDPALNLMPSGRSRGSAPPGSAPPKLDPHALEGVWWVDHYEYLLGPRPGVAPPLKPKYVDILERRLRAWNAGAPEADAETTCRPHGMPRLMQSPYPLEIVQTQGQVTILHEVAHEVRRIYMDQPHRPNLTPSYLGDSVGHWDGDTLVVDTVGENDKTQIDDLGSSHSDQIHVIERIRKVDGGAMLQDFVTVIDPVTLEHPYSYTILYHWRPDIRIREYSCEENNRNASVHGVTAAR